MNAKEAMEYKTEIFNEDGVTKKYLMKVQINEDGSYNTDSLFSERHRIVENQRQDLFFRLVHFNDIVNTLDSKYFAEIKDEMFTLMKVIQVTK